MYLRSATYGSPGVESPPRSVIRINGVEYHPHTNGHTIVLVDYNSGTVDQVMTYRTDIDQTAGARYELFLKQIPSKFLINRNAWCFVYNRLRVDIVGCNP